MQCVAFRLKTLVGVCYRAPLNSAQEHEGLIKLILKASNEITLVIGDFNFAGIDWELMKPVEMRKSFQSAIRTHYSVSTCCFLPGGVITYQISLCLMMKYKNITVGKPFGTSDHCVTKWDMVIRKIRNNNCNRVIFDYCNVDYEHLREVALKIDWIQIIKGYNVEDDFVAFKKVIFNIKDKYIPKKSCKVLFRAKSLTKEVTKCCQQKMKHGNIMLNKKQKNHMIISVRLNKAIIIFFISMLQPTGWININAKFV